jgi:hypothetical protein
VSEVKPLANLLEIDLAKTKHLSACPEQIDEGMEKILENISHKCNNAENEILNGIQVMGSLMWLAGSPENRKSVGVDDALLADGGDFIKSLAEMLREVLWHKVNADYSLKCALEHQLKEERKKNDQWVSIPVYDQRDIRLKPKTIK